MDCPSKKNSTKPSGFALLLLDIRTKLGPSWPFFEECLQAIFRAATRGRDTSAWLEQMEQLLQSREDLAFSCQGILFLLAEKGIKKQAPLVEMAPPPLPRKPEHTPNPSPEPSPNSSPEQSSNPSLEPTTSLGALREGVDPTTVFFQDPAIEHAVKDFFRGHKG